jgi:hypothetical protein
VLQLAAASVASDLGGDVLSFELSYFADDKCTTNTTTSHVPLDGRCTLLNIHGFSELTIYMSVSTEICPSEINPCSDLFVDPSCTLSFKNHEEKFLQKNLGHLITDQSIVDREIKALCRPHPLTYDECRERKSAKSWAYRFDQMHCVRHSAAEMEADRQAESQFVTNQNIRGASRPQTTESTPAPSPKPPPVMDRSVLTVGITIGFAPLCLALCAKFLCKRRGKRYSSLQFNEINKFVTRGSVKTREI